MSNTKKRKAMKFIKLYAMVGAMALGAMTAVAQEANRSGYFLEVYNFRHQLNPAFAPEQGYFSIPILANFGVGVNSNVGINKFLYKLPNGDLTTFMNSQVDGDDFLSKLSANNKVLANMNLTVFSWGFRAFHGFNTINVSLRTDVGVNVPKDLFTFMKLGQNDGANTQYSFGNIRFSARSFGEIALGHQHKITDELNIGAKLKFLVGLGYIDAQVSQMDVTLGYDKWQVLAQGQMNIAAGSGLRVPTNQESGKELDKPNRANQIDYDGIDYDKFDIGGTGMAVDLGATYDMHNLVEGLTLSASLLDLGSISWKNNIFAETPGTQWSFNGFQNVAVDSDQANYEQNKLGEQIDGIFDDLEDCVTFERKSSGGSRSVALNATSMIGAEYVMPFYDKLTGGVLLTHRFAGCFSWTEGRFSANLKPSRWFGLSVNYAASTFGSALGWMLNLHPSGFTFFVGSDFQFFKVTPQYVPVGNASMQVNLGMSFTFGHKA
jgi:hypothetical protein